MISMGIEWNRNGRTKVFWKNHGTKWWKCHCHVWSPEEKCHGWFFSCLPSNPEQSFPEGVHLHSQLPQHRKWLCQPMACRHMVAEAEAIRGLHLANHWPVSNGGSPELGHHRSMEPKKFSIHRTWFPISCLIFQCHITRIANVWSQPIQTEKGMDNFQTCLSVSMLVAMATETFSSGKNPTMLW